MVARPALRAENASWNSEPSFLPVEFMHEARGEDGPLSGASGNPDGVIEIDLSGGHRFRVSGPYDPEALIRLIRGLSG